MLRSIANILATLTAGSLISITAMTLGFYLSPEAVRAAEQNSVQTQFGASDMPAEDFEYSLVGTAQQLTQLLDYDTEMQDILARID